MTSYQLVVLTVFIYSIVSICCGALLQLVAHPQDSSVATGANVTLVCKFNMVVSKCSWFEDFFKEVKISKYNVFADKSRNGTNTNDCTLVIISFSRGIDASCFYCVGTGAQAVISSLASRKACLSLQPPDVSADASIVAHPQDATVREDDSVILNCTLRAPVLSCGWIRNDRKDLQRIHDRYEYINFGRTLNNSGNDCSIRINQFKEMDAVYWMCYAQMTIGDSIDILKSNWAKLTFVPNVLETTSTTIILSSTVIMTTESPTTKMDPTTSGQTEPSTTETPVLTAQTRTEESITMVIIGTLTLVLVLVAICLQVAVMYFMKYRLQSYSKYQVETINLPRIEKQNLLE